MTLPNDYRTASESDLQGPWKNRLATATSPYLLQHAHNPVDWFPWGEEAFEEARKRGVPVFSPLATRHATGATSWSTSLFQIRASQPL